MDNAKQKKLSYKTWVEIDRTALLANMVTIQRHISANVLCLAVIKANAYGHGLVEVARILQKLTGPAYQSIWFGVDSIDEAQALKKMGAKQPIIILGYIPKPRLLEALSNNFRVSVYNGALLEKIKKILIKHPHITPHLHLKIESGTNRLGIQLEDLTSIKNFPPIEGIYTHFAEAENPQSKFYQKQLKILKKAIWILQRRSIDPFFIHTASSAALLTHSNTHFSLVRLGISLYGLWPSDDIKHSVSNKMKLKPVLTWKTRIAQIKKIPKGETVGYDRTWKAKKKTRIAVLPLGYYDGYDRRLSNCGEVLINGKRTKVIGRICMNMIMIDVSNIPIKENDEVILLGKSEKEEITAEDIAKKIGTIHYEIVSRIHPLLPRVII